MTLTNFDASQVADRKNKKALSSWKLTNDTLVTVGSSVLKEQPTFQSSQIVTRRNLGAVLCGCNPTVDGDASIKYEFNGLSQGNQVQ